MLAVSSAALAVTAHALADGGVPDAALTLLLTGLIGWTATALAGKARGPLATIALLGGGQLVMHLVLTTLAGHDLPAAGAGVTMIAAHVVATVCTALLLARADAMLLAALSGLRAVLPLLFGTVPVPAAAPAPLPVRTAGPGHLLDVQLRRAHGRRGPPRHS
ncbi:hypothetical protein [Amycolatopsis samaneae]|uniref:Uncharacterized protein n=1 Tax=Amycolatopsis samaneae TaxID=664691 RepID=A0ABW5GK57_9PSEU